MYKAPRIVRVTASRFIKSICGSGNHSRSSRLQVSKSAPKSRNGNRLPPLSHGRLCWHGHSRSNRRGLGCYPPAYILSRCCHAGWSQSVRGDGSGALSIGLTSEIAISAQVPGDAPVAGLIGRFFHHGWRAVRGNLVQDEGRVSLVVNRQPARIRTLLEVH